MNNLSFLKEARLPPGHRGFGGWGVRAVLGRGVSVAPTFASLPFITSEVNSKVNQRPKRTFEKAEAVHEQKPRSVQRVKILILGELSFDYSQKLRAKLPFAQYHITATSADSEEEVELAADQEGFTIPYSDPKQASIVKFDVRGEQLEAHFGGEQFDVINAPRGQPPLRSNMSATQFNKRLLMDILNEAKNYLTANGRIDVQLGPRHPASRLKTLRKSRQVKFMAAEYEYGVSYTPRSNTFRSFGKAMARPNARWTVYIFEGEILAELSGNSGGVSK